MKEQRQFFSLVCYPAQLSQAGQQGWGRQENPRARPVRNTGRERITSAAEIGKDTGTLCSQWNALHGDSALFIC